LSNIIEVPFAEFEKEFDAYMDRIEAGESFIVRKPDGTAVMAVPADEYKELTDQVTDLDWENMMTNHDDAS
jgi:PHD/YefM family antitoxin component YafN of YafNO toxin-antitoxin module